MTIFKKKVKDLPTKKSQKVLDKEPYSIQELRDFAESNFKRKNIYLDLIVRCLLEELDSLRTEIKQLKK